MIFILYSLVLIFVEFIYTTNTKIINPQRIAPTSSQLNAFIANINGAPIPPAPTSPNIEASFIFISNLYITVETKFVNNCGNIPYLIFSKVQITVNLDV